MTGFAEKRFHSKTLSVKVSIKSLNHRYFDWNYSGAQIGGIENRLRSICQRKVRRGRIEVFLELNFLNGADWDVNVDEGLLEKVLSALEKASARIGKSVQLSLENILRLPYLVKIEKKDFSEDEIAFLEKSFERTLDEMFRQRKREGKELGKELRSHTKNIRKALGNIERLSKEHPLLLKDKLHQRLKELTENVPLSEEKLAEEAAYYAQKYDLAEEIARMKSHLGHVDELLSPQREEPVGRNLDFIVQEMYREMNTIGSKSQDMDVINDCLKVKGEIESIRQQIQNIE